MIAKALDELDLVTQTVEDREFTNQSLSEEKPFLNSVEIQKLMTDPDLEILDGDVHDYQQASPELRAKAMVFDIFFLFCTLVIFGYAAVAAKLPMPEFIVPYTTWMFYWVVPTAGYGQTFGKRIVGLRVIDSETGMEPSFWTALIRESVGRVASSVLLLGYIRAFVSEDKLTFHDQLSATKVILVEKEPEEVLEETVLREVGREAKEEVFGTAEEI